MNQTTIFDFIYPKYKITKPIRLIETFSGYGSQALALKYLGVEFEHWKTCEWAIKSIQAYKDIHFTNDTKEISMSIDEMIDYLYNKGISSNYNEPMTKNQISRLNEKQLKTIIENIEITHNLVNIQQVKGQNLEIIEKEQYEYILTYSFPCQDLSLAGKRKGMADTTTRSGMLWEVERILNELKATNSLPQILLMENVPQVHGSDNVEHFNKWQLALENMGYKNYFQDLIATDYGIPQTRNRCFMISILGDYSYTFPPKKPLKLKLKDMLEDNVDEKYYIEDDLLQHIIKTKQEHSEYTQYDRYNGEFEQLCRVWKDKAPTLHTKSKDIKIYEYKKQLTETIINVKDIKKTQMLDLYNRNVVADGLCQTADTGYHNSIRLLDKCKIRKLTPRECGRLMNVKDEDIDKLLKNQSNSSAFHLFGDSICTNVLMAIFGELLDINWIEKFKEIEDKFIDKQ